MTTTPNTEDWLHLKAYGFAPGNYLSRCHKCNTVAQDLDKYAITCRPCAETMHAKRLADLVLELAEAVDNAAEDIGGSRPQLDILREAVQVATQVRA